MRESYKLIYIYEYASMYIFIYAIYEYTYAITISEKRDYKFKGKWEVGRCVRVLVGGRKGKGQMI